MKRKVITVMTAGLIVMFISGTFFDIAQAKEKKPQSLNPSKVRPVDQGLRGLGQKGGGQTPDPPADPSCSHGSVG
ncbi:MAG: hypothetical protein ACPGYT_02585, partial [Nitrospirales bacterium]